MTLKLYNTLTRKTESFKPIHKGNVGIYTCGPTVYDYAHIGNFRAYICADILKRYLKYKGFKVKHVMNITDVDDKTIKRSKEQKISLKEFTKKYTKAFFDGLEALNIEPADVFPKATEHIKEMAGIIKKLEQKGIAYKSDDGSIYYNISKFKNYGKFANLKMEELKAGARVKQDEYEKGQLNDFALWKAWDKEDGNVFWEIEAGKGRPGWHIECSAMSMKYLGENFDIHTGGIDLIFPHHQNEIAQSEAATGKKFVGYWLHNEWLLVEGKKMSKSLNNFYTLRDLLEKDYNPVAVRYLLMSTHYRQRLNFTLDGLEAAKNSVARINDFIFSLKNVKGKENNKKVEGLIKKAKQRFESAMDNDLSVPGALAVVFDFIRDINKEDISKSNAKDVINTIEGFDSVFGVLKDKEKVPEAIKKLAEQREKARKEKDWDKADKIREQIKKKGFVVEDSETGARLKKI
ncbi:cysteine--tRNA ligase [Candidatus Woesearchaeota archaeon]|nr:cysteine--tRNA ligase [Candidatus Woesearchaeota archaeon]|tara:strand:- start:2707 stop:4089 length:1383 start_codon:yes stop_codon:yes gene_type:complete